MKKVMKKVVLTLCCLAMAASFMPVISGAKEVQLKLATWGPPKHFVYVARDAWIKEVNEGAAGKVKIVEFPGGQLYGPHNVHQAVAKGLVDMGVVLQPSMMAMVPMIQGVYLPFGFENIEAVSEAYSGESLAIIEKAMEKKHLKLIYTSYTDPVHIWSNKGNINTIDDFKGLRVLSQSPMFTEIMAKLGAAPDTSIPYTEWYMALKRSVSDSQATAIVGGYFAKSFEVAPYITKMNMSYPTILVVMNLKKWKKLPKDVQELMVTTGKKHGDSTLAMAKGWEAKFTGALAKAGATITTIAPEERQKIIDQCKDIWMKWADKNGADAKRLLEINMK